MKDRVARTALVTAAVVTGAVTFGSPERLAFHPAWSARLAAERVSPAAPQGMLNTVTAKERAEGWRPLFDGTTTAGWRGFRQNTMPAGWQAIDGALTRAGQAGDIVTADEFGDFELTLDWSVPPNGNSGIHFRVTENDDVMWHLAPEYQVIDNAYKPPLKPAQYAGANYDLHPPSRDVTRPVGAWNQARLLVRGAHVEHWLNGVKVVDYEIGSADWNARVKASKFGKIPPYGTVKRGYIALQDHGNVVSYRNLKIRPIGQ